MPTFIRRLQFFPQHEYVRKSSFKFNHSNDYQAVDRKYTNGVKKMALLISTQVAIINAVDGISNVLFHLNAKSPIENVSCDKHLDDANFHHSSC